MPPKARKPGIVSGLPKHSASIAMDPAIWEALAETAEDLLCSRSVLVERICLAWLNGYQLTDGVGVDA